VSYAQFCANKHAAHTASGFHVSLEASPCFPFQSAIVEWALALGRAAVFADTGLGKTIMQLEWARSVYVQTGSQVLILAPLAVVRQTEREAAKFGISGVVAFSHDAPICVWNYDQLHKLNPAAFSGVVLDESSILKNAHGRMRNRLIQQFMDTPYKLACTATPSPNDHVELGNHAEWLGVMSESVMRARWFINDLGDTVQPWRLKMHAVDDFWRWVTTWARCVGKPSHMGDHFSDDGYVLPLLNIEKHLVNVDISAGREDGALFRQPEMSATSIHKEKRLTADDRARFAVDRVLSEPDEPWIIWVETNYDQDAVELLLPNAITVRGSDKPEQKAAQLLRFADEGGVIITKPKIAGMGLNWQHCARQVFMGGSFSYEGFYQAVRRSWRFGQERRVTVHVVMAATEQAIWRTIHRKSQQHAAMKSKMYAFSRSAAIRLSRHDDYRPAHVARVPTWLKTIGETS